ncbi:MAG: chemotaxis protein CheW [Candidatus Riflebacteria bacterium HGW-Riflebacteria-1]|jgi:purine-binding chemotaxis protein CheW|nr:MAG: chemotaxis protein CheW [Candidatus Riflebacteria bacterium HGW-Riflebacteria-1]
MDLSEKSTVQNKIVIFTLGDFRCALPLPCVEKVVRAVEISPLPKAPEIILGVINKSGTLIPVIDIRRRFRFPQRELSIDDRYVIAKTAKRLVALVVDAVDEITELTDEELVPAEADLPFAEHLKGVAKIKGNLIMIYDLDQFLSLDEEQALSSAISTISSEKRESGK